MGNIICKPKKCKSFRHLLLKSLAGISSATCFNWDISVIEKLEVQQHLSIELNPHQSKLIYITTDGSSPEGMNLNGKIAK